MIYYDAQIREWLRTGVIRLSERGYVQMLRVPRCGDCGCRHTNRCPDLWGRHHGPCSDHDDTWPDDEQVRRVAAAHPVV